MIKYWTNFVKYDDPNFSDNLLTSSLEIWKPFYYDSALLKRMTAKEKMNNGQYLQLKQNNTVMIAGFSKHRCDFWNNTKDSNSSVGSKNLLLNIEFLLVLCLFNVIAGVKLNIN